MGLLHFHQEELQIERDRSYSKIALMGKPIHDGEKVVHGGKQESTLPLIGTFRSRNFCPDSEGISATCVRKVS